MKSVAASTEELLGKVVTWSDPWLKGISAHDQPAVVHCPVCALGLGGSPGDDGYLQWTCTGESAVYFREAWTLQPHSPDSLASRLSDRLCQLGTGGRLSVRQKQRRGSSPALDFH